MHVCIIRFFFHSSTLSRLGRSLTLVYCIYTRIFNVVFNVLARHRHKRHHNDDEFQQKAAVTHRRLLILFLCFFFSPIFGEKRFTQQLLGDRTHSAHRC